MMMIIMIYLPQTPSASRAPKARYVCIVTSLESLFLFSVRVKVECSRLNDQHSIHPPFYTCLVVRFLFLNPSSLINLEEGRVSPQTLLSYFCGIQAIKQINSTFRRNFVMMRI